MVSVCVVSLGASDQYSSQKVCNRSVEDQLGPLLAMYRFFYVFLVYYRVRNRRVRSVIRTVCLSHFGLFLFLYHVLSWR